ncbi:hypothetical protein SteCoe_24698 [Stentor coeruleus]|uniref:J domain-containing protein n=1 Tax=Stentor coeruleus TaxID=5963 RepID=A0A1R2BGW8_9CILI|nr:hypothetical protein SteCoe_24698 [Stentor coeruleus]
MGVEQILVVFLVHTGIKKKVIESETTRSKFKWILIICLIYAGILLNTYYVRKPNAYEILELSRGMSNEEIRESYKQALKFKHPDKNLSPNANEEFRELKKYYDFIRTPDQRIKYEKYGGNDEGFAFWGSFSFYIGWIFVCNSLYFSKIPNAGRNLLWILSIVGILETYALAFVPFKLTKYTIFEQLEFIRIIFPAICVFESCLESLRVYNLETIIDMRTRNLTAEGRDLIEIIKSKNEPEILSQYLNKVKITAKSKHESGIVGNLISIGFLCYMIYGKIFSKS